VKLAVVVATPEVQPVPPVALLSGSFWQKLEKAAALGFAGVELMCLDPEQVDRQRLVRELSRLGLTVPAIGTGALPFCLGLTLLHADEGVRAEAMRRAQALVEMASELGAMVTIGSFRGWLSSMGRPEDGRVALAEKIGALADVAAARGVRLALEPLNRYEAEVLNTAAQALAFLEELGRPNVGLLLDTFHVNIEEPSIGEAVRLSGPRLWHVHLGDSNRWPPGCGHFPFAQFLDALRSVGYGGFLSAELLARPDPDEAARLTYEHMSKLLKPG